MAGIVGEGIRLEGLEKVLKNLNKEIRRIRKKSKTGLIKSGFLIKRGSQLKTPVDLGNLKASHDVIWRGSVAGFGMGIAIMGGAEDGKFKGEDAGRMEKDHESMKQETKAVLGDFEVAVIVSAAYALFVHEKLVGKSGKPIRHKVGEAKFLEKSINENAGRIIEIIKKEAE